MNRKKMPALYAVVLAITVPTLFAEARLFEQWQHLTPAFPNIPADALIGLAVTSHVRGQLTTATFEQLSR